MPALEMVMAPPWTSAARSDAVLARPIAASTERTMPKKDC